MILIVVSSNDNTNKDTILLQRGGHMGRLRSFKSTNSGGGEQFLLPECRLEVRVRPVRLLRVWISEGLTQADS